MSVSVDDEGRQAGLWQRWGFNQTRFVSDPGGDTYLKRLGLFDPEERGGIALPGMLVIAPDGTEVSRFEGRDFADRTNDDDLWQTLESLGLDPIDPRPWEPDVEIPDDLRGFFRPEDLNPYFSRQLLRVDRNRKPPRRSRIASNRQRTSADGPRHTRRVRTLDAADLSVAPLAVRWARWRLRAVRWRPAQPEAQDG